MMRAIQMRHMTQPNGYWMCLESRMCMRNCNDITIVRKKLEIKLCLKLPDVVTSLFWLRMEYVMRRLHVGRCQTFSPAYEIMCAWKRLVVCLHEIQNCT